LPIIYPEDLQPSHERALQEFEQLYNRYLSSPNRKDLCFKKVLPLETYALLARGHYVVLATINHNRTSLDAFEVLRALHEDVDEKESFILSIA